MHDKNSKAPLDPPRPQLVAPVFNPDAPPYHLDAVLTRTQAAEYLRVSESFLKKKAAAGKGPAGYRCGKRWTHLVRDLVAWRETFRIECQVAAIQSAQPAETAPAPVTLPPPVQEESLAPPRRGRGRPRRVSLAERGAA